MARSFDELWTLYIEGELGREGWEELSQMLDDSPELVREAADLYEDHRLLGFELTPEPDGRFVGDTLERIRNDSDRFVGSLCRVLNEPDVKENPTGLMSRMSGSIPIAFLSLSIALVACAGLVVSILLRPADEAIPQEASEPIVINESFIATLISQEECVWETPGKMASGQRLPSCKLRLLQGAALIQFDGGAMLVVDGPAELLLESPGSAELVSGSATVRTEEEAAGFVLRTPTLNVVDIGTEFSLAVEDSGVTELHVLEGGVEWQASSSSSKTFTHLLTEGSALRFDSNSTQGREVDVSTRRFRDMLPRAAQNDQEDRVLAYDGFEDPSLHQDARHRPDSGFGWSGPWDRAHHDSTLPTVASFWTPDSLQGPVNSSPSLGGRVDFLAGEDEHSLFAAYTRELAEPVDLSSDGVTYFSFLLERSDITTPDQNPNYQWFRAMLTANGDFDSRIGIGMSNQGKPMIFGPTGNVMAQENLPESESCLFIGKIVSSADRPDQLFLQVVRSDEMIGELEPANWMLTGKAIDRDAKLSVLHLYNGLSRQYSLDEIRLGTTWRSVTTIETLN